MRVLNFEVESQTLKKSGDFSNIVAGTKNYLVCGFSFNDTDWNQALKVAVFNEDTAVPILNGSCKVPDNVTDRKSFKFYVVGRIGTVTIKTNQILIEQVVMSGGS